MKRIYQHLKRYMVIDGPNHPRRLKYCRINLIMFGNQVVRLCGYHTFCQQCNSVASAMSHTLLFSKAIEPCQQSMYEKRPKASSSDVDATSMPSGSIPFHNLGTIGEAICAVVIITTSHFVHSIDNDHRLQRSSCLHIPKNIRRLSLTLLMIILLLLLLSSLSIY
ncbi:hypothetical protein DM01DRAFT_1340186 [Hesseltinella vesiculosa]|uniref:Uncharacterized protein n=1 Tax=Hesseltinella vesiculosa TaxID=101127 RepID=A0A1X2G4W5_9FUNG|nr:hypothetical protein DM01DRAFT_1340186 [Hesseltinella vesiculosa]